MSPLQTRRAGFHNGAETLRLNKHNIRQHSSVQGESMNQGQGDASDSSQNTCSTFSCQGVSNACQNCTAWYMTLGYCCTT